MLCFFRAIFRNKKKYYKLAKAMQKPSPLSKTCTLQGF